MYISSKRYRLPPFPTTTTHTHLPSIHHYYKLQYKNASSNLNLFCNNSFYKKKSVCAWTLNLTTYNMDKRERERKKNTLFLFFIFSHYFFPLFSLKEFWLWVSQSHDPVLHTHTTSFTQVDSFPSFPAIHFILSSSFSTK